MGGNYERSIENPSVQTMQHLKTYSLSDWRRNVRAIGSHVFSLGEFVGHAGGLSTKRIPFRSQGC